MPRRGFGYTCRLPGNRRALPRSSLWRWRSAPGVCISFGIFAEKKAGRPETLPAKGVFDAAPLRIGLHLWNTDNALPAIFTILCLAPFVMADKPGFQGTPIAWEELGQRLSLLCMYLPIMMICVPDKFRFVTFSPGVDGWLRMWYIYIKKIEIYHINKEEPVCAGR